MEAPVETRKEPRRRTAARSWHLFPQNPAIAEQLAAALALPPILAQLLVNRGITETTAAERFLATPLKGLLDPAQLPGVRQATELLLQANRQGDAICIYGDYDVDGLTGTAILWQTLLQLGTQAQYYVPHRLDEGYGLNSKALAQIAAAGAKVVVTVDCGISSVIQAQEARRLGLKLIITDHHEPKKSLPDADVLVHPRLPGSAYPFGDLSGSGVAFKLAWALCQASCGAQRVTPALRDFLVDTVGLAALGMVADWVPLFDENRIIVRHGLARLPRMASAGLQALLDAAGFGRKNELCTADISFGLAPRLNAAGRLGCARLVVDLLTTASHSRALELTRFLEQQNSTRQQIERRIFDEARAMIESENLDSAPALVLASSDWHAGVIGIVAGKLVEIYSRPVLIIAWRQGDELASGSGRSVPGFALHKALCACEEGLASHGGHAAAAGFKIAPAQVDAFRERFCGYAAHCRPDGPSQSRWDIDAEIPLSVLTPGLVGALGRLEPYGAGNPRPKFLAGPLEIAGSPRKVGKGERHLQFRVRQHQTTLPVIAFGFAERLDELLSAAGECCIVFTPSINEWRGFRSIQLEMLDFQAGPRASLA
jgi:single-stranded-DNA-specific exonuclease